METRMVQITITLTIPTATTNDQLRENIDELFCGECLDINENGFITEYTMPDVVEL